MLCSTSRASDASGSSIPQTHGFHRGAEYFFHRSAYPHYHLDRSQYTRLGNTKPKGNG